ncbi:MAG: PHP domain-containing protein [Oscillospiraceae bacterium]|nr:PHP domain-containing protein [Oscillospiraceae bacterium]
MGRYCDLHTHSHYSDGTLSPAQIIAEAERLSLSAVALTDHNTVAGLPEFLAAARNTAVQAVPGVEISTNYKEKELHILGLFLKPETFGEVTDLLDGFNRKKEESNRLLIRNLNKAGYTLDYADICRSHREGTVNRAVIASALLERGYVSNINEAFRVLLSKKSGYYFPPERLSALEAIAFLRNIHAVPVLAHSFLNLKTEEELRIFLKQAVPCGLAAMETMYSAYSAETTETARRIAREFGLAESGGSDFHGQTKPHISLGTGKGGLAVPADFTNYLKNTI